MIEREKAVKTAKNKRIETPETRRLLDYSVGDYVQIVFDKSEYNGRPGVIIGVNVHKLRNKSDYFAYTVKLSDTESEQLSGDCLRFLRHGDE